MQNAQKIRKSDIQLIVTVLSPPILSYISIVSQQAGKKSWTIVRLTTYLDRDHNVEDLRSHSEESEPCRHVDIEQKKQEELPVRETNAIAKPGTVMIHVEHASIAGRAVMSSLRFENMTNQTVSLLLLLGVFKEVSLATINNVSN